MKSDMDDILKDIRKRCRFAMNGVASASMRNRGLNYKLNFGVSIQKIKEIADRYEPSKELAQRLWSEDGTRELKILATTLYPIDQFSKEEADKWVTQIPNQEIREQVTVNLFQNLPFAIDLAQSWSTSDSGDIRTSGYWLYSRLILTKKVETVIDLESYPYLWSDIVSENTILRNASSLFLKNAGRLSKELAQQIMEKLQFCKESQKPIDREVFDSIAFEFEFFYGDK